MEMIASRNQTSHTYNEKIATAIATAILSRYVGVFEDFLGCFDELERAAK